MGEILRKAVEDRRKNLINKLITFNVYQKDDNRLWNLTLSELEYEFKSLQSKSHPHCNIGAILYKN